MASKCDVKKKKVKSRGSERMRPGQGITRITEAELSEGMRKAKKVKPRLMWMRRKNGSRLGRER